MSKPNPEQVMEAFRKRIADAVDEAIGAGVSAPNLVLVLEMTKINLAMQFIQDAQMQAMHTRAAEMANEAAGKTKSGLIVLPGGKPNG